MNLYIIYNLEFTFYESNILETFLKFLTYQSIFQICVFNGIKFIFLRTKNVIVCIGSRKVVMESKATIMFTLSNSLWSLDVSKYIENMKSYTGKCFFFQHFRI